ncbi:phosphatases II [Ascoidea rubescens DSM 1968]|uniref:Phosphatases II n=1 Tax=Ascoidea rubescens DSM 1968 TaxID=1344418 RepID=A0A1D2VDC1_9ASCO|nr:phosphatases II [Ascoidea rubescens DSM 1968]ODV59636.1 phosphatases II [Ascoidea rubescens DSM 1968]
MLKQPANIIKNTAVVEHETKEFTDLLPPFLLQNNNDLFSKFNQLEFDEAKNLFEPSDTPFSSLLSGSMMNRSYNRYSNIFPFDRNRIKLPVVEDKKTKFSDYINASSINLEDQQYIAAQGPLSNTINDFWQMVYDNSLSDNNTYHSVIIMLTPLLENSIERCTCYWPMEKDSEILLAQRSTNTKYKFELKLRNLTKKYVKDGGFTHSQLLLTPYIPEDKDNASENAYPSKIIHHLYFARWNDFSQPTNLDDLYNLINYTHSLHKVKDFSEKRIFIPFIKKKQSLPLFIHCSAGVGRTGTFITLHYLLNYLKQFKDNYYSLKYLLNNKSPNTNNDTDPIYETIKKLRSQRARMVQDFSQFCCIYKLLCKVLIEKIKLQPQNFN